MKPLKSILSFRVLPYVLAAICCWVASPSLESEVCEDVEVLIGCIANDVTFNDEVRLHTPAPDGFARALRNMSKGAQRNVQGRRLSSSSFVSSIESHLASAIKAGRKQMLAHKHIVHRHHSLLSRIGVLVV